jgi:hypothetical protein
MADRQRKVGVGAIRTLIAQISGIRCPTWHYRLREAGDRSAPFLPLSALLFKVLDEHVETTSGHVSTSTMHLAKGLEFRAVVVMACDDEIIPLEERIEAVGDDSDLEEVYDTERHLLYVACTRARDHLLVSGVDPVSEFLDDFSKGDHLGGLHHQYVRI